MLYISQENKSIENSHCKLTKETPMNIIARLEQTPSYYTAHRFTWPTMDSQKCKTSTSQLHKNGVFLTVLL